MTEAGTV